MSPPTTRAFAVQMRPPGGSRIRGYSPRSSHPFHPRDPSAQDEGNTPSRPTRRGNRAVHRPPDAPAPVRDDEVLTRNADAIHLVERLFDRVGGLERSNGRRQSIGRMRHPRVRPQPPAMVGSKDGSPDRPRHLLVLRGLAGHGDRFVEMLELAPAVRRPVAIRDWRDRFRARRGRSSPRRCW